MGFYNVVNRTLMQNGVSEDISQVVANFDAIASVLNGQIDNLNLKGSPALAAGEVPVWTGSGFDRSSVTKIGASSLGDVWTTYTPVWTTQITNPVLNNGTLTGRYAQIGKTVIGRVMLQMGSGTTYGSGAWYLTLPITGHASIPSSVLGGAFAVDASAGQQYPAQAKAETTTTMTIWNQSPTFYQSSSPFVWAVNDTLVVTFTYEAA